MIILTKHFIFDVWHGSKYTLDYFGCFVVFSQRDTRERLIYAKLIIVLTPNLKFSPYSEVIVQHSN